MLHTFAPRALVATAIRIGVHAMAMFLIKAVVPFVLAAVLPDIVAKAMHDSVLELALEVAPVGPLEAAVATHLVVCPVARVP